MTLAAIQQVPHTPRSGDVTAIQDVREREYFEAWRAATLLMPAYFGGADVIMAAVSCEDIKPDMQAIRDNLALVPFNDEAYLIALVSFADDAQARRLLEESGSVALIGRLASRLSVDQRRALARLMELHPGS